MLTEAEATELGSQAGRRKTAPALAPRARIILACGAGLQNKDIAARLGVHAMTVGKWRRRFLSQRIDGLHRRTAIGIEDARIEKVIVKTLESQPESVPVDQVRR